VDGNCSVCQKCVRTLLIIDFLGRLEEFSNIFDLKKYFDVKNERLIRFIAKNDSFGADIKWFFERSGAKYSAFFLFRLKVLITYNNLKRLIQSLLSAISRK